MAGRIVAATAAASGVTGEAATTASGNLPAGGIVAAQVRMRFQTDLQRLHAIKSVKSKIAAKRDMLPAYEAFCAGILEQAEHGDTATDDIFGTVMVWRIDTGDYAGALTLAGHMLRHDLPMPARYNRDTATTVTEEIADAALRALGSGEAFALDVLNATSELTAEADMPDQVRAKLAKAIGLEIARQAGVEGVVDATALQRQALDAFKRAQSYDAFSGCKKNIEKIERALRAAEKNTG
jgi:hypothetical protein